MVHRDACLSTDTGVLRFLSRQLERGTPHTSYPITTTHHLTITITQRALTHVAESRFQRADQDLQAALGMALDTTEESSLEGEEQVGRCVCDVFCVCVCFYGEGVEGVGGGVEHDAGGGDRGDGR